jgi:hypothetical protein
LNDRETLPIRKSKKKKTDTQVADLEILAKIISTAATYIVLIENEFLLNKKSTNHKEINSKTRTTSGLYRDAFLDFD